MNHNTGPGAIARNVHIVLRSFRSLVDFSNDENGFNDRHQSPPKFENEQTRFKMWAGNLGAHQSGRASLDYRLREAPHIHEQIINLLIDLSESLQEALDGHQTPSPPDNLDQLSEDSFTDSEDDDTPPQDRLSTLYNDIKEVIDCLLRLSVATANPAPHERVRVLGAGHFEDVSFRRTYDIGYVQDKFPNMPTELAEILGKALTRRRQFFKYREAHHAKLASGLETIHDGHSREKDTSRTEIVSKTVASSLPEHLKTLRDIDLKACVFDEDNRSDTMMSQTSYATSAGFLAGDLDGQTQKPPPPLRVPPLPAAAEEGEPFECPFCYRMVSASTRAAWKRHVFADLRPYTCLFQGCTESNADFDRRHLWQAHISQHHWRSWFCPFKCEGSFASASNLKHHLNRQHMQSAPEEQLDAVTALGKRPAASDTANACPVCGHTVVGLKPYVKHVGRHLEQLALFALPHVEDENDSEGDQESDEQDGTNSQADSKQACSPVLLPQVSDTDPSAPPMYECLYKPCPYKSKRESNCKFHMEQAHGWIYDRAKTNGSNSDSSELINADEAMPMQKAQVDWEQQTQSSSGSVEEIAGSRVLPYPRLLYDGLKDWNLEDENVLPTDVPETQGSLPRSHTSQQPYYAFSLRPKQHTHSGWEDSGVRVPEPPEGYHFVHSQLARESPSLESGFDSRWPLTSAPEKEETLGAVSPPPEEAVEAGNPGVTRSEFHSELREVVRKRMKRDAEVARAALLEAHTVLAGTEVSEAPKVNKDTAGREKTKMDTWMEKLYPTPETQELYNKMRQSEEKPSSDSATQARNDMNVGEDQPLVKKKPRGRRHAPLSEATKIRAALMRRLGSCEPCRERKVKCTHRDFSLFEAAYQEANLQTSQGSGEGEANTEAPLKDEEKPIRFKDAVGRKFSFPFHLCRTWQGMEDLIRQAFLHVEVIGPHVQAGHYKLHGPDGEIILPIDWEKSIKPGMSITMQMWPMDKNGTAFATTEGSMPRPAVPDPSPSPRPVRVEPSKSHPLKEVTEDSPGLMTWMAGARPK